MSSQVRLRLLPSTRCLFDDPIHLKVSGLKSRQVVTLRANTTDEKGMVFSSSATFKADQSGEIDLNKDPSHGGSYFGLEPMGLLWSMRPETPHKRLIKTNSLNPHVVKFSVHEEGEEGSLLAEVTNERLLMADGVSRIPVKEGNIRGVLFIPPGPGRFPAVLDLYTSGGGLSERRASMLANRGFVTLTVALYGHDDMPKNVTNMRLDYFEEAIEFLRNHEKVGSKGVGIISLSKSGDLAISAASFLSGVDATVWINGHSANTLLPLHYKETQLLPPLLFDPENIFPHKSGALVIRYGMHDPRAEENKATVIPVEKATGRFLFVAAQDDLNWDSKGYVEQMVERLKHHGKDNYECLHYPGAGHYLEPPYGPYCPSSFHGIVGQVVMWGGVPRIHAAAEVHMWKKILEFFKANLRVCESDEAKAKL